MLDESIPITALLPTSLRSALTGYEWTAAAEGESGGEVFRLTAHDQPTRYLKCGAGEVAEGITAEMTRLVWFAGRLPTPEVLHFVRASGWAWLLTSALPGRSAYDCLVAEPARRMEIVAALAAFLRRLHALPLADCPFHAGHELRLADARRRLEAGRVDESDFDPARAGRSAGQVWDELTGLLPLRVERAITHGDFSLGNVLLEDGRVTGCLDVGRAGAADPYQDLAILWRDLAEFGADAQRELFRAYGLPAPDERKLEFFLCLDEFF